eukprot:13410693-Alexandrium_andersonii.AAC.1
MASPAPSHPGARRPSGGRRAWPGASAGDLGQSEGRSVPAGTGDSGSTAPEGPAADGRPGGGPRG